MLIHVLSRDGQSISGSRDTLTGGRGAVPIYGLSRDGQNISGSQDTLTRGVQCPSMYWGWSENLGYSDKRGGGGQCPSMNCPRMVRVSWVHSGMVWFEHPDAILGRSEYFRSYGQVWYNPYSILRISMPFDGVTGHHTPLSL